MSSFNNNSTRYAANLQITETPDSVITRAAENGAEKLFVAKVLELRNSIEKLSEKVQTFSWKLIADKEKISNFKPTYSKVKYIEYRGLSDTILDQLDQIEFLQEQVSEAKFYSDQARLSVFLSHCKYETLCSFASIYFTAVTSEITTRNHIQVDAKTNYAKIVSASKDFSCIDGNFDLPEAISKLQLSYVVSCMSNSKDVEARLSILSRIRASIDEHKTTSHFSVYEEVRVANFLESAAKFQELALLSVDNRSSKIFRGPKG